MEGAEGRVPGKELRVVNRTVDGVEGALDLGDGGVEAGHNGEYNIGELLTGASTVR